MVLAYESTFLTEAGQPVATDAWAAAATPASNAPSPSPALDSAPPGLSAQAARTWEARRQLRDIVMLLHPTDGLPLGQPTAPHRQAALRSVHFTNGAHELLFSRVWLGQSCEQILNAFSWYVVCSRFQKKTPGAERAFSHLATVYARLLACDINVRASMGSLFPPRACTSTSPTPSLYQH